MGVYMCVSIDRLLKSRTDDRQELMEKDLVKWVPGAFHAWAFCVVLLRCSTQ